MLAYAGRLVLRAHSLGFEVQERAATRPSRRSICGRSTRAEPIEKFFKGRQGFAESTKQFDHKIEYIWVDPKLYDARKWETIIYRLLWWAGPVGFMMMAKSVRRSCCRC